MNSYLISKYSQSTHYHYKKGINDLLDGKRCQLYIQLKDHQCYDTQQEHLNKYYTLNQLKDKLKMLVEYYKYHNDIPRIFMIPAIISLNYYHDRKRRLEYYRIAKLIQTENLKNPDKPQKGIVGDTPLPLTSELLTAQDPSSSDEILSKNDKILQGITFLIEEPDSIEQIRQQIQSMVKMKKQPNNSSTKINSIASNTTTSKSNKQSILKQSTKLSKSPPLKPTLIEGLSPRVPKSSKHISPPNIKSTKPKSPSITSPVQQFMKLSASMKQQFQKLQCVSARNNNNTTTFRKGSVTHILNILKSPTKNKSQQIQHISQTPRDQESKRSFNNNNKKVHQLELQVMSDLQNLLQKKTCLTHRSSMNKQNNNIKKKLNTRELNQFKCIRLPLSNREINNQKKE